MAAMTEVGKSIRRILAGLAVVCFFLPLGQCTYHGGKDEFVPAKKINWAPTNLDSLSFDLIVASTFFWPLAAVALGARVKSRVGRRVLLGAEICASAAALFALRVWLGMYNEVRAAGYVAVGVFACYLAVSLAEGIRGTLARLRRS